MASCCPNPDCVDQFHKKPGNASHVHRMTHHHPKSSRVSMGMGMGMPPPHPHPFPPPLDCSGCDDASSSSSSASKILRASLPKSRRPALFTVNNFSFAALSITMRHGRGTHFMLGRCEWQRRKNTRARPFYPLVYSAGENCCWCPICTTNESRKVA